MFLVVLLFIILVPVAELIVVFKVAGAIGWLDTLGVLLLTSVAGAWLVRRQGISLLMRIQGELSEGRVPTKTVVDGLLLLVAGALMLTPGFLTDAVGIILLFPPTRIAVRGLLMRRFRSRLDVYKGAATSGGRIWTRVVTRDEVIDADARETRPRRDPSGELDP
ncbi:MAG: FxsA family protein [Actinobacteria bacterium]|nr:MAG: FxsA family protein [Actinomycetota bacterium]